MIYDEELSVKRSCKVRSFLQKKKIECAAAQDRGKGLIRTIRRGYRHSIRSSEYRNIRIAIGTVHFKLKRSVTVLARDVSFHFLNPVHHFKRLLETTFSGMPESNALLFTLINILFRPRLCVYIICVYVEEVYTRVTSFANFLSDARYSGLIRRVIRRY